MLQSELIKLSQRHAPRLHQRLTVDQMSHERRCAMHEAIHTIYASRSGDNLFVGIDRHKILVEYLATDAGMARLNRLANWVYRHGMWEKMETERLQREWLNEYRRLEVLLNAAYQELATKEQSISRNNEARLRAMREVHRLDEDTRLLASDLRPCRVLTQDLLQQMEALGPAPIPTSEPAKA